jgi:hypothetical protein
LRKVVLNEPKSSDILCPEKRNRARYRNARAAGT